MVDTFKGPPQRQGVIGRLALDRALSDYGFEINLSVSGLSSETITIYGEGVSGALVSYPPIYFTKTGKQVVGSAIQNGDFTIKVDDLRQEWESLAFVKSGASDRVGLEIESLFDYVEAR